MYATIDSADLRSVKAVSIASQAGQWLKVRSSDGRKAYGVPSECTAGRYYLTTCETCDCQDARRGHFCKHRQAVRLFVTLTQASRTTSGGRI
jgi:hypothetical protein